MHWGSEGHALIDRQMTKACRRSGWLATLLALIAACAGGSDNNAPGKQADSTTPAAVFTVDLWPGEGIPVIEAQRERLPLHESPDPSSPAVDTLRAKIGQRVAFDSTRFQTIESGRMRAIDSLLVNGRAMGDVAHISREQYYVLSQPEVAIPVALQSTIDFLQYRAEGTCFIRIDRLVIDAQPCPGFGKESVAVEREPVTRWWIRVRGQGDAFGWLLVSDSTAQSVRREF